MKRVRIFHFLLVCSLLLAQLGGFAHAFSHLQHEEIHHQDGQPHTEKVCTDCLAFADTSAALPSQPDLGAPAFEHGTLVSLPAYTHTPALAGAYRSRAPPPAQR